MKLLEEATEQGFRYSEEHLCTPFIAAKDKRIQLGDTLILSLLLSNSLPGSPFRKKDKDGIYIEMSLEDIAQETGSVKRTVSRVLDRLEEAGYIKREIRTGKSSKFYVL